MIASDHDADDSSIGAAESAALQFEQAREMFLELTDRHRAMIDNQAAEKCSERITFSSDPYPETAVYHGAENIRRRTMIELALLIIFVALLIVWAASSLVALALAIPVALIIIYGGALGLNWWQSLLTALVTWGLVYNLVESFYGWHFRRHYDQLQLPADIVGREIEVEGRLVTILGSIGRKVVVRNKKELRSRRIDPNFVRTKI